MILMQDVRRTAGQKFNKAETLCREQGCSYCEMISAVLLNKDGVTSFAVYLVVEKRDCRNALAAAIDLPQALASQRKDNRDALLRAPEGAVVGSGLGVQGFDAVLSAIRATPKRYQSAIRASSEHHHCLINALSEHYRGITRAPPECHLHLMRGHK